MAKKHKKQNSDMTFLEHLEEFRWHLVRSILAVVGLAVIAFVFNEVIFDTILIAPKNPEFFTNRVLCNFGQMVNVERLCINTESFQLININMSGQFSSHIMVSIFAGIILSFPYIFYEFWKFLEPALYNSEKKYSKGAVFFSSLLFLIGILFGYYLITPLSVHFLGSYHVSGQVINQINLKSYIATVTSVSFAAGVIFELPVLVYFLSKVGIVTPEFLRKYRKHSIVVILALAAIITPPDIFSQVLVCLPLILLYEVGIVIAKRIQRKEFYTDKEEEDMASPAG